MARLLGMEGEAGGDQDSDNSHPENEAISHSLSLRVLLRAQVSRTDWLFAGSLGIARQTSITSHPIKLGFPFRRL
jgi:hypothetical protein